MPNADGSAVAGIDRPPWNAPNTMYFYGGPFSNFAPTPDLWLPYGYYGHTETDQVAVQTVEHWFQACKATSRREFDRILGCSSAGEAKRAGRELQLRSDWEQVKFGVMLFAVQGKFALEPYRSALLITYPRPLAEASPSDFVWGARDPDRGYGGRGYGGRNLLGVALMCARAELVADVHSRVNALGGTR